MARALVFVRELGAIDNAAYRAINGTDTLNASGRLRRLRDLGLLQMKGSGSRTYYIPGPKFVLGSAVDVEATQQQLDNGHHLSPDSHHLPQDSHHPWGSIPSALDARRPAAGTKPRRDVMRNLILDLCAWHPLSARELASLLRRREHKPLVRDYLSPMVAEGVLAYTIPDMENHPDQRYTTVNDE